MNKISSARISRLIGNWRGLEGKIGHQLGLALAKLIAARELPVGGMLPSERALATALAISRGTVVAAYASLRDAGILDSRHGSGHRIIASATTSGTAHTRLAGEVLARPQDIDMTSGALPPSPVLTRMLAALRGADLAGVATGLGYDAAGLPTLRWAVARYYSDLGLPTHPDNILITSGAQQAVWLLANALVDASDAVVVEDPVYRGSLEAFHRRNARIIPVAVTQHGLNMEQLEKALRNRPKLLYLFPEAHNPTGRSLDEASRRHLVRLLERYPTFLVEDGAQNELSTLAGTTPRPLAGKMNPEMVATIGTLSKLFWGGLRIGWIRSAPSVIKRLASFKAVDDLGCSMFDQHIAVGLLENIAEARIYRHQEVAGHLKIAEDFIAERAQGRWHWARPAAGTAIWIHMPGVDTVALCQEAQRHRLFLSPGSGYSAHENFGDFIRLPFVRPPATMQFAIDTICNLTPDE
ncbi:PLP-dependent aminotransferase family protein [Rhizobium sp. P44RR-XXIV]|uniref:aminotransferase-like domain-containing protein n=1 Tax=Rhizobium sp. P44RR-XXIV TaxID=1921145 RepID=UPI0009875D60|nr:PLP-dependent aminotransferase family protein [Rhizobium sp. P44RR-XXIV]TIX87320.1 PLP-dependent aminotransferase family protein [Rhizobium sp. P44RR-XXIV]